MGGSPRTGVIDYDMGNIHSVAKALEASGHRVGVVASPEEMAAFAPTHLVLPGVGAFGEGRARLEHKGWIPVIERWLREDRPFLGICLGMQLLFDTSQEFGTHRGLGFFSGEIVAFDPARGKVPQIGWNDVVRKAPHPLWSRLPERPDFYFVHSYRVRTSDRDLVLGETDYQEPYPSMVGRGRIAAVQFHPEKSQAAGLTLLENFGGL